MRRLNVVLAKPPPTAPSPRSLEPDQPPGSPHPPQPPAAPDSRLPPRSTPPHPADHRVPLVVTPRSTQSNTTFMTPRLWISINPEGSAVLARSWNLELLTDGEHRPAFDLAMPGHGGRSAVLHQMSWVAPCRRNRASCCLSQRSNARRLTQCACSRPRSRAVEARPRSRSFRGSTTSLRGSMTLACTTAATRSAVVGSCVRSCRASRTFVQASCSVRPWEIAAGNSAIWAVIQPSSFRV